MAVLRRGRYAWAFLAAPALGVIVTARPASAELVTVQAPVLDIH